MGTDIHLVILHRMVESLYLQLMLRAHLTKVGVTRRTSITDTETTRFPQRGGGVLHFPNEGAMVSVDPGLGI